MNTPYQSRSFEVGLSSTTHYHQHHPYNQRGFRGRRPYYRNRGSYQQPRNTPWKPHVTVKEEPLGDASLLARLEPTPGSLLNRLSPAKDSQSPEMSTARIPLMNRISGIKQEEREVEIMEIVDVDEVESIASSRHDTPQIMPNQASDGVLAERLIADALSQGLQLADRTPTQKPRRSPESEAAVDDILAAEDMHMSSSPPMPVRPLARTESNATESVVSASSRSASADRATLIEQAKRLIAPLIARNAKLRNPESDPKVLEEQALRLVTEEQCLQFMKFAAESRKQMKAGNPVVPSVPKKAEQRSEVHEETMVAGNGVSAHESAAGPPTGGEKSDNATKDSMPVHAEESPGAKRARSTTNGPNEPARPYKMPRTMSQSQSGEAGPSSIYTSASASFSSSPRDVMPVSRLGKAPPTAPRALRMAASSALPAVQTPRSPHTEPAETILRTQGKSSLSADQSSTAKLPDGGAERASSPAAALDESVRPARELKKTVSFASSEDMDISSSPQSTPAVLSPPIRQDHESTVILASVEAKQIGGEPPSKVPSPQGSASIDSNVADERRTSKTPSADRPLHSNISEAGSSANNIQDGRSRISPLESNLSKGTSNVNPNNPQIPSASTASNATLSPGAGPLDITSASNGSDSVLPNGSNAPIGPSGGPFDDIPSEAQPSPVMDTLTARADTNPPKNGDNSITPQERLSAQRGHASAAKCVDSVSLAAAMSEPETSTMARRSPLPPPQAGPSADKRSSPVPCTDTPPSAVPSSSSAAVQPQTSPTAAVGGPQSTTEEVAAPPPDATSLETHPTAPAQETVPMEVDSEASDPARPVPDSQPANPAPLQLPGLCFAEIGRTHAGVNTVTFEVDDALAAAAKQWVGRGPETEPASCAVFKLLCLHASDVQAVVQTGESVSPPAFAAALRKLKTRWPPRGQLVVEINRETESCGIWLPKHLGPEDGPIDVTPYIVPGTNTIRLIQLSGQAELLFILYVGTPDESDTLDSWDEWLRTLRQKP